MLIVKLNPGDKLLITGKFNSSEQTSTRTLPRETWTTVLTLQFGPNSSSAMKMLWPPIQNQLCTSAQEAKQVYWGAGVPADNGWSLADIHYHRKEQMYHFAHPLPSSPSPNSPPDEPADAEQLRRGYSNILELQQTNTWMHFWRIPKTQTICLLGCRIARARRMERFKPRAAITFLANTTSLCLSAVGPAYRADTGKRCHLGRKHSRWKGLREGLCAKAFHRQTTSRAWTLLKKHRRDSFSLSFFLSNVGLSNWDPKSIS